ncbi:tropomyosin-1, isoforms 33/34 [Diabrotica virgifera virgifera]|uniref:Tropomyosin-1, isoforms 33/34 isoform X1 n=1 Tax=Diabrotica virgifera virgifera TaxID=50390 RepID=A0A6P7GTI8_DIAVI|nr:tropomyosin-1, isoforms 33/34 [Diabrotica virgifera virgifera]
MRAKSGDEEGDHSEKLADLNKKIMDIKKKIQLSEGQRKALFEDCEAERKSNIDEIAKLKKDLSQLVVNLHESKSTQTKFRLKNKTLEGVTGSWMDKSPQEVMELLDTQIIDKTKQFDLMRYRTKQRRKYLTELAAKYQKLLNKHDKRELSKKVEVPVKKSTTELQNNIHAMEVQVREAMHVKNRYSDIFRSLKTDSDNFEGNIKKLEEALDVQRVDIEKLQKVMDEASRMRSLARGILLKEEKSVNDSVLRREKEAAEGRRLVNERKQELERLEKKIFLGGKLPVRPEPEGAEDAQDEEKCPTPPHPVEVMSQAFEILKQATGGTSTEEVLERYKSQKETDEKLMHLRTKTEEEKKKLERKMEALNAKLDSFKYAEAKEAERKTGEMDLIQQKIEENVRKSQEYLKIQAKKEEAIDNLSVELQNLYLCINPLAELDTDPLVTLQKIKTDIKKIFDKIGAEAEAKAEEAGSEKEGVVVVDPNDEKWLPAPYAGLVRRTPLPQTGASPAPPPPPGSEDEEEVPSRGYLKRQAQLVVDAKSRRKNVRLQVQRRN